MTIPLKKALRNVQANIYQLEIVLLGTEPAIWRRVKVPGNANLGWLHAVIQVAMGWTNSHLHQFHAGKDIFTDTSIGDQILDDGPAVLEESEITLAEVAPRPDDRLRYEYDFGDSWDHLITVEQVMRPEEGAAGVAECVDGARACPPEDCGGPWGYAELVEVIKDPKHPEHKQMKTWVGRRFDPEAFDAGETNKWLKKLKGPRVTEAQLRKVLMERDRK